MRTLARFPLLLLAAAVLLLVHACRGEGAGTGGSEDLDVDLAIVPTPPTTGEARIVITVSDREGEPLADAEVEVEGNMSHAGMSPMTESATREGSGRYVVAAFPFTMGGDWILTTRVREGEELLTAYERRVRVVGGEAPGAPGSRESPERPQE